jgi:site-specific DNA recombinase
VVWDVYARQSLDNADGIERQIEDCTREIERLGGIVGKLYLDNDESANSKRKTRRDYRPEYRRLMADVAAKAGRAFVAQDQDRLMRDIREGEDLIDLVERPAAGWCSPAPGRSTSAGRTAACR